MPLGEGTKGRWQVIAPIPPALLAQWREMIERDLREHPMGQHGRFVVVGVEHLAELIRGYRELEWLVDALRWLPVGTVVDFTDADGFLEELRDMGWTPGAGAAQDDDEDDAMPVTMPSPAPTQEPSPPDAGESSMFAVRIDKEGDAYVFRVEPHTGAHEMVGIDSTPGVIAFVIASDVGGAAQRAWSKGEAEGLALARLGGMGALMAGRASAKAEQALLEPTNAELIATVRFGLSGEGIMAADAALTELARRLGVADGR